MNNIKMLRDLNNLSQENLADKIGVSQQAVAKWETGESMPRADKLIKLAQILEVTVDELLKAE